MNGRFLKSVESPFKILFSRDIDPLITDSRRMAKVWYHTKYILWNMRKVQTDQLRRKYS